MNNVVPAPKAPPLQVPPLDAVDIFGDSQTFEHAQRIGKLFASSTLVPPHFQNNLPNCLIALQIARRFNEEPLTVFQQLYIVNTRPAWSSAYMINRCHRAGVFKTRITWETKGEGDSLAVTARAVLADSGEPVEATADMKMAAADGWTKNQKYKSMPEHMLRWRSAGMLIRLFAPECLLGFPLADEIDHLPMRDVTPAEAPPRSTRERIHDFARQQPGNAGERPPADADGDGGG